MASINAQVESHHPVSTPFPLFVQHLIHPGPGAVSFGGDGDNINFNRSVQVFDALPSSTY